MLFFACLKAVAKILPSLAVPVKNLKAEKFSNFKNLKKNPNACEVEEEENAEETS